MRSATDITRARAARPARETAASVILARLRTAILDLSLPPGTALIEKDLT